MFGLAERVRIIVSCRQLGEDSGPLVFDQDANVAEPATLGTAVAEFNGWSRELGQMVLSEAVDAIQQLNDFDIVPRRRWRRRQLGCYLR